MNKNYFFLCILFMGNLLTAQDLEPFEVSRVWLSEMESLAPTEPTVKTNGKKQILIFSLHTGFDHWTIPHTEAIIKLLGEKSGAYRVTTSKDIDMFNEKMLKNFDAIVLNNTCSTTEHRNIFLDIYRQDSTLSDARQKLLAKKMENNLLNFVKNGKGLVVLHGGITMLNKSDAFSKMVGGSFDYHPKQQEIQVALVDAEHPLVSAFDGKGFSHVDEPYFFNNAYEKMNFRPLLSMNSNKIEGKRSESKTNTQYLSWIKKHGRGRVFFSSPSHNPQSYNNPKLLQFLLDGLQYATGDLKCDDSPIGKPK